MKPIPDEILIPAIDQAVDKFGKCGDTFGEEEAAYVRRLCGDRFKHVETDWVRQQTINLRKSGKLKHVAKRKTKRRFKKPSGWYAEYLEGDHWQAFRLQVLDFWGGRCCLCHEVAVDVHHNTYVRLNHERLTDCVALCRDCHKQVHHRLPDWEDDSLLWD